MNKLIVIIIDGLNDRIATANMGYMTHLVEVGQASKTTLKACLPTLSRPLYETILTGKTPSQHGIVNNMITRKSHEQSLFHKVEAAGKKSAAAAYYWVSELYMHSPFNHLSDCYQLGGDGPIHHGIYYYEDVYPDAQLFDGARFLINNFNPDFVLVHPMNVDYIGHNHGGESYEYSRQVRNTDKILSDYLNEWLELGYSIIVTADHGMGADGSHSGVHMDERQVPLWYVGQNINLTSLPETSADIYGFALGHMGIGE